jgi:predicted amino acid dehydrogenase
VPAATAAGKTDTFDGFTYESYFDRLGELAEPFEIGTVSNVFGRDGTELRAHVVAIPLIPRQFLSLPEAELVQKLVAGARLTAEKGARMVGLGGYTAAGGMGLRAAPKVEPGLTSGNAFTAYASVVGCEHALETRGGRLDDCTVCVVGATGSVGHGVTAYLARHRRCPLVICGRHQGRLERVARKIHPEGGRIRCETDLQAALASADVVITATSHGEPFIDARWCKQGAVVCDTARPPDIIQSTVKLRPDLLVFDGGIVELPGKPNMNFHPMLRPKYGLRYACFAETAILTLSGHNSDFALGQVTAEEVEAIAEMAERHGFSVGDLRWQDEIVVRRTTGT